MSRRNHADCIGNDCDAVLSGEIIADRSLLAQFGLTPKSKCGLASSEAVDPLDALGQIAEESTG
jgi:hypothetical protein